MIARYDLSCRIAGFDFFFWLLHVRTLGATEIVIDTSHVRSNKWDAKTVKRRIESIILPGPALLGLPSRIGTDGESYKGYLRALLDSVRSGNQYHPLRSVLPPAKERYTVTIRRTERVPGRNSNETIWRRFADEIGARVVEDYDIVPIHLHERMALYAGAEMNFGVGNGPVTLGLMSPYPTMMFDLQKSIPALKKHADMSPGDQFPWATKDQFQIYEPDELPVIRAHFENWKSRGPQ